MRYLLLDVRVKLLKTGDETLDKKTDNCAPINNILNSMIGTLRIYLNNVLLNNSNDYYFYKSYIQTLYSFNREMKETYLETGGW